MYLGRVMTNICGIHARIYAGYMRDTCICSGSKIHRRYMRDTSGIHHERHVSQMYAETQRDTGMETCTCLFSSLLVVGSGLVNCPCSLGFSLRSPVEPLSVFHSCVHRFQFIIADSCVALHGRVLARAKSTSTAVSSYT